MKNVLIFLTVCLCGCAHLPPGPLAIHRVTDIKRTFEGRSDGLVSEEIIKEKWKDKAFGAGVYFFSDPKAATICLWHTNAFGMGGSSRVMAGDISVMVDSNVVPAIKAGGDAAGQIGGTLLKTFVKPGP